MFAIGKVLAAKTEKRDLVSKEGVRRNFTIHHVILLSNVDGENEILNCKTFDENYVLPKIGSEVKFPFRQYNNQSGVGEITF